MQGDSKASRMYLPEVDTDDAVKIWCRQTQEPPQGQPHEATAVVPSAWLVAEQEEGSESESEDLPSTTTDDSSETSSSSSTATISSSMLRRWHHIRKCYADNPDVLGDIFVYRVLTYMGHPHWRKEAESETDENPNLRTVLQATIALRLEDLRQKRQQMETAWNALDKGADISRDVIEYQERAINQLEEELRVMSRSLKNGDLS